ncbi:MAG: class I SAM-dependent rRNA methyltransferase [candidate division Zixibacteria bacterium]|nr:class I SAM-dependent rRNA methyltransferase [candidate division Zixibacteria bacterium]
MVDVILKKNRDKPARQYHPWVYSGAIDKVIGSVEAGETVTVRDNRKEFIAYGYYNPHSQVCVRLLEWDEGAYPDDRWWHFRLERAVRNRDNLLKNPDLTDCGRLVFGEADFLPGLIVDRYADFLAVQFLTMGVEKKKKVIVDSLFELMHPTGIYERSDVEVRLLEGLDKRKGVLDGVEPPEVIPVLENGLSFRVNIKNGHKTGFYLDQRDNRLSANAYAEKKEVLDCFSYTGAFAVYLLKGGATSVTLLDASASSLQLARENIALNSSDIPTVRFLRGDAFTLLRQLHESGSWYDMIVLDPPKFAFARGHVKKALAAYKDVNLLALKLLRPDGILVTFSCSGTVSVDDFQTAVFWASVDARCRLQFLQTLSHPSDHPVPASFPEGRYLKGLICRRV